MHFINKFDYEFVLYYALHVTGNSGKVSHNVSAVTTDQVLRLVSSYIHRYMCVHKSTSISYCCVFTVLLWVTTYHVWHIYMSYQLIKDSNLIHWWRQRIRHAYNGLVSLFCSMVCVLNYKTYRKGTPVIRDNASNLCIHYRGTTIFYCVVVYLCICVIYLII